MKLSFYQCECGNAARMQFSGTDGLIHNVLVDAGFERTFHDILIHEIREMISKQQSIDAWIVSHIHDDHIGGVLAYIKAIRSGQIKDLVADWYYNPPRVMMSFSPTSTGSFISNAKSIAQGDQLVAYLASINKLLPSDISVETPTIDVSGVKLTFLSPNAGSLAALRSKYPAGTNNRFERIENDNISQASAGTASDYNLPLTVFDSIPRKSDTSIENGSSISFLAEYNGKKMLWLADAFPNIIIQSLEKLGYTAGSPLKCDWVVVSHHGSSGNNTRELYACIESCNYLISANGNNRAKLPTKACLASILNNPNRSIPVNFYFTYDNSTLRSIFEVDGADVYSRYNFQTHFANQFITHFEL